MNKGNPLSTQSAGIAALPVVEWGVRFAGSPSPDQVTVCTSQLTAVRLLRGCHFCGNADAVLVGRAGADAAWIPQASDLAGAA